MRSLLTPPDFCVSAFRSVTGINNSASQNMKNLRFSKQFFLHHWRCRLLGCPPRPTELGSGMTLPENRTPLTGYECNKDGTPSTITTENGPPTKPTLLSGPAAGTPFPFVTQTAPPAPPVKEQRHLTLSRRLAETEAQCMAATQQVEALKGERQCIVCLLNDRSLRFDPCGHVCCCVERGLDLQAIRSCPVCQSGILSRQRMYL